MLPGIQIGLVRPSERCSDGLYAHLKNFTSKVRRKNSLHCGLSHCEALIAIKDVNGKIKIPLIRNIDLQKRISSIPEEERKKIGYVHLGGVPIMIKALFGEGMDTPIKAGLMDNR